MPFRLLYPKQKPYESTPPLIATTAPKINPLLEDPLMADMRMATIWYAIFERDPTEARQKLLDTAKKITGADMVPDFFPPCIVAESEGKTKVEQARIRRAQKRMATIFANLVDRLVRYDPNYRMDAFDRFNQDLQDRALIWTPFECEKFRKAEETEPKKKPKKRTNT